MPTLLNRFSGLPLRVTLLIPLVLSLITSILTAVTVSSGTNPGTLQDLAIFKLNISKLDVGSGITPETKNARPRRDFIDARGLVDDLVGALLGPSPSSNGRSPSPASALGGLLGGGSSDQSSSLQGAIAGVLSGQGAGALLGPAVREGAVNIQGRLGVPDWYSLHPQTFCNGIFNNPDDPRSGIMVRSCTTPGERAGSLSEALGFNGPLSNFTDVFPLPKALNQSNVLALDMLSSVITLLTVVFILATVFSFLAMLANALAIILPHNKIVILTNALLTGTAGTLVSGGYIGSYIVTIVFSNRLNRIMEDFKVVGSLGSQFLGIGIAATLLSFGAAGIWGIVSIVQFRANLLILYKMMFAGVQPTTNTK